MPRLGFRVLELVIACPRLERLETLEGVKSQRRASETSREARLLRKASRPHRASFTSSGESVNYSNEDEVSVTEQQPVMVWGLCMHHLLGTPTMAPGCRNHDHDNGDDSDTNDRDDGDEELETDGSGS